MNWTQKPLGELVAHIRTGSTPSTLRPDFFDGSIPWFTPSDIGEDKNLIAAARHISSKGIEEGKAKLFPKSSLLVTCIGNIGRVGILREPSSCNQQITSLQFNDEVYVDYAYYWFVFNQTKLEGQANQAVVPILNNERLQEIEFNYPTSKEEQQRLAALLDRADRLRRSRRYARQLGDTFLQSVFLEMFGDPVTNPKGWRIERLEDLLSIPPHIGTTIPAQASGKQLCVRVGEVGDWAIHLERCQYVSLSGRELERFSLATGDLVLTRAIGSESHLGKLSIMGYSSTPVVFDSHVMRLRPNSSVLSTVFLAQWLRSDGGRAKFMGQARRTAVQFNINSEQISALAIPLPPLPLQHKFAAIVGRFERLRAQQREAERQAEGLFQGLLGRAFRGEL